MSKRDDHKQMIFLMPQEIHQGLKVRAVKEKKSMTEVLNNLAGRYVKKELSFEEETQ